MRTFLSPRSYRSLCAFLALAGVAACGADSSSAPIPLDAADIRAYVSPAVAAGLDGQNRFPQAHPESEKYPQITGEQAAEMAVAFARTFAPYIRPYLERQHGAGIDFHSLEVVSPAYYAATPYRDIPEEMHPGLRNGLGPYYLVYLGRDGAPVLSVGVAAFTGAKVEGGRLVLPVYSGADIEAQGVRRGEGFSMPFSPENAVRHVAAATGSRAAAVPELVMPDHEFVPQYARWKITLDRPVQAHVSRTRQGRQTREVYVGLRGELSIPADAQPERITQVDGPTGRRFEVGRKPERPTAFERVTLAGQ
jgi:hypothetical protein